MVSSVFREALLDRYHGEQFGEAVFETLLSEAQDLEQAYVFGTLLQLESEGKAVLRPVLSKLGLALDEHPASRPRGVAGAQTLQSMPWHDKFAAMAEGVRARGLPQYEALATLVGAEEDPAAFELACFMGRHERAILAASENIAAKRSDPLAPVIGLLHFPLLPPARHGAA